MWTNIAQGIYQCNVGPWLTNNFSKQNKLCNVVSTKLGQHCIGISYTQCCPNTSETTLHTKITCAILVLSAQQCVCRKITYIILSWSAWGNIAQNSYLCNVDTLLTTVHSLVNVVQIRLRQCCTRKLLLQCCPRPHRSSHRRCPVKKSVRKNFAKFIGNTCVGVSL